MRRSDGDEAMLHWLERSAGRTELIPLPNGMTVVGCDMAGARSTAVAFTIGTGFRDDGLRPGAAHVLEHVTYRCATLPGDELDIDSLEAMGITFNATTGPDSTTYSCSGPPSRVQAMVDHQVRRVTDLELEAQVLAAELSVIREELAFVPRTPFHSISSRLGPNLLFSTLGGDPHAAPVRLTSPEVVRERWQETYVGSPVVVGVTGPTGSTAAVTSLLREVDRPEALVRGSADSAEASVEPRRSVSVEDPTAPHPAMGLTWPTPHPWTEPRPFAAHSGVPDSGVAPVAVSS